jgi:biopolymer transport protein ExbD/biopolymer transport protein TolR
MARRRHRYDLNADVNVVSLIDVMLLLLVIFMITAPMMQGGVDITLPKTEAKPIESKEGLTISVNRAGEIYIGDAKYNSLSEFRIVFKTLPKNRTQGGVYLRADKNANYGLVLQVLAAMYGAGVTNVGLISESEEVR